jgi:glycosyltransferase involved in cell wall biosynthesis
MHLNLLLATSGLPIVYDLDDALHYIRRWQAPTARTPRTLKDRLRVRYRKTVRGSRYYGSRKHPIDVLIRLSKAVIVGNDYLRAELARDESSLVVLPTCVPVDPLRRKQHRDASPVRIGWIGTRGNLLELREIDVVFFELSKRFGDQVILSVVSSAPYETTSIRTEFVPWSVDDESDSILTFDVGIMPLADALFARGKCSLKAIQYMAHGIPAVVSPVGMNVEVVRHGRNGYLARSTDEWLESLSILVADTSVRAQLGRAAFETVRESYSSEYALGVLRSVFERCSQRQLPKRPAYIGSSPQKVA